jgi:hypothetical protein
MRYASQIKPSSLKVKHDWIFAWYSESKSDREDEKDYSALLFRNEGKSIYGIIELSDQKVNMTRMRARHAACLRKRRAGTGPSLLLRRRAGPQALPLTWALRTGKNLDIGAKKPNK